MKLLLVGVILVGVIIVNVCFLVSCGGECDRRCTSSKAVTKVEVDSVRPVIEVYVENSGSMNGYVNGMTEFKQAVYNYLSDIKISDISDSLNLYYINSTIIPHKNATGNLDDIQDFIDKLDPTQFKAMGGNLGTSDIAEVLKNIMRHTNSHSLSILISDCIFSPGTAKDAKQYLVNQQIGIKGTFAKYVRSRDLTTLVYQLSSSFTGKFFDKNNHPTYLNNQNRPFYIWVIGDRSTICNLRNKVKEEKFKGSGVEHSYTIFKANIPVNYSILNAPKIGKFKHCKKNTHTHILQAEKESKGVNRGHFMLALGVDFSQLPLSNDYLLEPNNYELSDNDYSLEIVENRTGKYTHTLKLSLNPEIKFVKKSNLSIRLKNKPATWIEEMNDDEGINIHSHMNQTFGIKYLVGGIFDAFTIDNQDNYAEMKIYIN